MIVILGDSSNNNKEISEFEKNFLKDISEIINNNDLQNKILIFNNLKDSIPHEEIPFYFIQFIINPLVKKVNKEDQILKIILDVIKLSQNSFNKKELINILYEIKKSFKSDLLKEEIKPILKNLKETREEEKEFKKFPEENKENFLKEESTFFIENIFDPETKQNKTIYLLPINNYEEEFNLYKESVLNPKLSFGNPSFNFEVKSEKEVKFLFLDKIRGQKSFFCKYFTAWIVRNNKYCPIGYFSIYESSLDEGSFSYLIMLQEQKKGFGLQIVTLGLIEFLLNKMPPKNIYSIIVKEENKTAIKFAEKLEKTLGFKCINCEKIDNKIEYKPVMRRGMNSIKWIITRKDLSDNLNNLKKNSESKFVFNKEKINISSEELYEMLKNTGLIVEQEHRED